MKKANWITASKFLTLGVVSAWMATAVVGCGKKDPNADLPAGTNNSNPFSTNPCSIYGGCTTGTPTQSGSLSGTQVIPLAYAGGLVTLDMGGYAIPIAAGDKVILAAGGNFGHYTQKTFWGGFGQTWNTSGCGSISAQSTSEGAFFSIDGAAPIAIGPYKYFVSSTNSVLRVGLNTSGQNGCVAGNSPVVQVSISK